MAAIERYVLVDAEDREQGHEYESFDEAKAEAEKSGCAVIVRYYEYDDSELVWTPNGRDTWPPEPGPPYDAATATGMYDHDDVN